MNAYIYLHNIPCLTKWTTQERYDINSLSFPRIIGYEICSQMTWKGNSEFFLLCV